VTEASAPPSRSEGFGNRKGGGGGGGLGGSGGDAGSSGAFAAQASVARANIAQLLSNINTVQRLSSALGSPKDTVELRERLHHVIEETKLLCADSKAPPRPDLLARSRGSASPPCRTPPFPRTKWTRRVPHPVLIGHAASLTPY
jgi:hypothetical protein